jgi:hypothetical protein
MQTEYFEWRSEIPFDLEKIRSGRNGIRRDDWDDIYLQEFVDYQVSEGRIDELGHGQYQISDAQIDEK